MKKILTLIVCTVILSCSTVKQTSKTVQSNLPILKANIERIQYTINAKSSPWVITPKLKPDRLKVGCGHKKTVVKFISDIDSITFNIKRGDTVQFNVLFKGKTALTEIVGVLNNVNFSDEYIKKHQKSFEVVIPEVQELAMILISLSEVGQNDSMTIDRTTAYYTEVLEHFSKYKHHPALDTINHYFDKIKKQVKKQTGSDIGAYLYAYSLKMNACGYLFDAQDRIVDDNIIHKIGFEHPEDPFAKNKELFADFAKKSQFRDFYKMHEAYYAELISTYHTLNPVTKMQSWLENKFGFSYGHYLILFSPLVNALHATREFEDNDFKQTMMFISSAEFSEENNRNVDEMVNSKVVFTEIDHNFVNPISDKYLKKIGESFKERSKWVQAKEGTSAYPNPYTVFNEYMTWAFFSLYCIDNYPEADVNLFIPKLENQMGTDRGFKMFEKFNQKLIAIYMDDPNQSVEKMYEKILDWCDNQ